jgi:hypothetical protein
MVRQIEGANYHTMYSVLVQKKIKLSELNLTKINKALNTKFKNNARNKIINRTCRCTNTCNTYGYNKNCRASKSKG